MKGNEKDEEMEWQGERKEEGEQLKEEIGNKQEDGTVRK